MYSTNISKVRSKLGLKTICLCWTLFLSINLFADNSTNSDQTDPYSQFAPIGNPAPSWPNTQQQVRAWCQAKLLILKRAKENASSLYTRSRFKEAYDRLFKGLNDANNNINTTGSYAGALTSRAIFRGITLGNKLLEATKKDPHKYRRLAYFFLEYYPYIERVANQIDIPYFVPGDCNYCRQFDHLNFERRYVQFALEQVAMVLKNLADIDGSGQVYPLGSVHGRIFLTTLELTTWYAAHDLMSTPYSSRLGCTIDTLYNVNQNLKAFNANKPSDYLNVVDAVHKSYYSAAEVALNDNLGDSQCHGSFHHGSFQVGLDCHGNNNCIDPNYKTIEISLYREQKRINNGDIRTIPLDGFHTVKNIYISAVGIGSDALYEVFVNGRSKGKRHVPRAVDPTFKIDINEYTSSIEIQSISGNIRVLRILSYQN